MSMSTTPSDEHLGNLFILQFDSNLQKSHEFYVEYLLWFKRAEDVLNPDSNQLTRYTR